MNTSPGLSSPNGRGRRGSGACWARRTRSRRSRRAPPAPRGPSRRASPAARGCRWSRTSSSSTAADARARCVPVARGRDVLVAPAGGRARWRGSGRRCRCRVVYSSRRKPLNSEPVDLSTTRSGQPGTDARTASRGRASTTAVRTSPPRRTKAWSWPHPVDLDPVPGVLLDARPARPSPPGVASSSRRPRASA